MKAPAWFLRELQDFDSDLRLRWSPKLELWQIERRVRRSLHPGTIRCDGWHDDFIRAREGYLLVASVPARGLSRTIFERLRASDLWANGGWARVASELEAAEEQAESARETAFANEMGGISREVYDLIKHREGRSVYNAGWVA